MDDLEQYRAVFLAESADYLQQITDGLLALERTPSDPQPIETVFRGAHSLKGMGAAMGYQRTAELTHKMESLMARFRQENAAPGSEIIGLMLSAVDLVRDVIDDESNGRAAVETSQTMGLLEKATADDAATEGQRRGDVSAPGRTPDADEDARALRAIVTLEESCVLKAVRAYMVIKRLTRIGSVIGTSPSEREIEDEHFGRTFEVTVATGVEPEEIVAAVKGISEVASVTVERGPSARAIVPLAEEKTDASTTKGRELPRLSQAQTVRITVGHLDVLVDLAGELVILRSRLERVAKKQGDQELTEILEEMHRVSADLQYEIMRARMVPVGNIFNRFPRMVRDLAMSMDKRVEFEMEGLDIELDRTVLDEIGDPLVHLLRNCVDHGVESSAQRVSAGKPEVGHITLQASREREHVLITVSDDGAGIDPEKIWRKAESAGLVNGAQRVDFDDQAILLLTCVPGFTTLDAVSEVSGRGVGMDAVKGKIEYLGGTIQINSVVGEGSEFVLRLPLTLAIIQVLIIEIGGRLYALPLSSVDEVFSAAELVVETVDSVPVVVLREGEIVPLVRLDVALGVNDPAAEGPSPAHVVVVESEGRKWALAVDALGGRREIVVKPLSRLLKDAHGFSGATILGDGQVILILDTRMLFTRREGQ
jgi:two-component system chemotaxis sensor kinase CheA